MQFSQQHCRSCIQTWKHYNLREMISFVLPRNRLERVYRSTDESVNGGLSFPSESNTDVSMYVKVLKFLIFEAWGVLFKLSTILSYTKSCALNSRWMISFAASLTISLNWRTVIREETRTSAIASPPALTTLRVSILSGLCPVGMGRLVSRCRLWRLLLSLMRLWRPMLPLVHPLGAEP